ncbi:hypothetical protein CIN01S_09_01010 [Chryseobacterium indologenes NBRC 14944]|nr:hypothetical protein CIN01S_09_01010 [Chryseobacterium indologenes NBRC 14944]
MTKRLKRKPKNQKEPENNIDKKPPERRFFYAVSGVSETIGYTITNDNYMTVEKVL